MKETRSLELVVQDNGDGSVNWWVVTTDESGQQQLGTSVEGARLRRSETTHGVWAEMEAELWEAALRTRLLRGLYDWG
jgi:hypothetical protein